MWQLIIAGLSLGFVSSFHCAGMCGPIALSLPVSSLPGFSKRLAVVLYHSGRIITYGSLGALFGLLGRHFYMAGFQKTFSIAAGVFILLIIMQQWLRNKLPTLPFIQKFFSAIQSAIYYCWNKTSLIKFLLIGMLNGLLPCGMVYFALVGALSFASPLSSVLFMLCFGAGTLPLMIAVHLFGMKYLSVPIRNRMKKAVPVFIAFMGVILILRGLNLGIPYLSPFIGNAPAEAVSCH